MTTSLVLLQPSLLLDSETQLSGNPRAQREAALEMVQLRKRGLNEMADTLAARLTRARQHELFLRKLGLERLRSQHA